ncbi:unnamed protein product [Allacma fusca]|uniref:Uncharacterized protein n=1 Tax=Allacma fusca TaxID=39272 RepID=A0A8J2JVF8_9HEXA|nr:unnamed protein product [Allacma fusca]
MAKLAVLIALMAIVAMTLAQGVKSPASADKKEGDLQTANSFYGVGYGYGLGYGYGGYGYGLGYGGYGYGYPYSYGYGVGYPGYGYGGVGYYG